MSAALSRNTTAMNPSRRRLLTGLAGSLLVAGLPRISSSASPLASGYKALVCVFMYGGNDANNTMIPMDTAGYAAYLAARGDSATVTGTLGLPLANLAALAPASGTAQFGLHPDLAPLQAIWNAGNLGVVFNTGSLVQPLTKAQYLARSAPVPSQLFSHLDQQQEWQTSAAQGGFRTGWGGRLADVIAGANPGAALPSLLTVSDPGLFATGTSTSPLALPATGGFGLTAFGGGYAASVNADFLSLAQADRVDRIVASAQQQAIAGLSASTVLSPILTGTSTITSLFAGQTSGIANQLTQVARMIENRAATGATRQVFFVSLGSFDTHTDQLNRQSALFKQLAPALKSFHDAMVQLGVDGQVTTFTMSDFARTLKPASGGGSDHAWGSHHFVMGGSVQGQTFYGTFPQLVLGGPDDISGEGRWLPTLSIDQYAATLASWFGAQSTDLPGIFPNLANFAQSNIGFMKPGT